HRSGYIAITLAFAALSALKGKKIQNIGILLLAGIAVIGMLTLLEKFTNINMLEKNINRVEQTFENTGTTKSRLDAMMEVFKEFEERPLTGIDYQESYHLTLDSARSIHAFNVMHPHNFVLAIIMTTGIVGTTLMFTLIFRTLRTSYKLSQFPESSTAGIFLFSSAIFFVTYAVMNTTMETSGYIFWYLSGITVWMFNYTKKIQSQEQS
ncbi:MAG: O-antigen ligase family protein, partial [Methylomonas sp.]